MMALVFERQSFLAVALSHAYGAIIRRVNRQHLNCSIALTAV